jgi:hypothetical protein
MQLSNRLRDEEAKTGFYTLKGTEREIDRKNESVNFPGKAIPEEPTRKQDGV